MVLTGAGIDCVAAGALPLPTDTGPAVLTAQRRALVQSTRGSKPPGLRNLSMSTTSRRSVSDHAELRVGSRLVSCSTEWVVGLDQEGERSDLDSCCRRCGAPPLTRGIKLLFTWTSPWRWWLNRGSSFLRSAYPSHPRGRITCS
eukprot:4070341-Amphidinium_carterae.1